MESLYILIPIAVLFIVVAGSLFFWAIGDGQFDDLESAANSILFEEPAQRPAPSREKPQPHSHSHPSASPKQRRPS